VVAVAAVVAGCGRIGFDDRPGDAAAIDAAMIDAAPPCLVDDFSANVVDVTKWDLLQPVAPVTVEVTGGELVLTLPPSASGYQGLVSRGAYDMRDGSLTVVVNEMVDQSGYAENDIEIIIDGSNTFLIGAVAGNLLFRAIVAGTGYQMMIGFDATKNHWRISHSSATAEVRFETSPDGATWTTEFVGPTGPELAAVRVNVVAGSAGTGNPTPGRARYDDVKLVSAGCP
jgi:hypothetical protein